jgi:teichuronic acid biosynthesis glycosyltransferase TuaC
LERRTKLLIISSLYPNEAQPRHGIFTENRMRNLIKLKEVEIRVVSPVPWFPTKSNWIGKYSVFASVPRTDERYGIKIVYPRYPVLPRIGMTLSPLLMTGALIRPIQKLIKSGYDFDIIDAYYLYPDGVAAVLLARYFRKPVIITAYGTDINLIPQYLLPRRMIQWAGRYASGITSVCQALKEELLKLGIQDKAVRVILHGVDINLFRPPNDRAAIRAKLGLSCPTLLSVGHLIERKGHHIVIKSLTNLPGMKLLIAGDGEAELDLKRLAASLGVSNRIQFLGHVHQKDLPTYYGAVDALVLASSREGIANVLLESMACGTPVIATNVWGAPEVITTPDAGILIPDRTPEAVSRGVNDLFASYPERSATRRLVEKFTWDRTSEQHITLINEIMKQKIITRERRLTSPH